MRFSFVPSDENRDPLYGHSTCQAQRLALGAASVLFDSVQSSTITQPELGNVEIAQSQLFSF